MNAARTIMPPWVVNKSSFLLLFLLLSCVSHYSHAVTSCALCGSESSCILQTSSQILSGGQRSVEMTVCNYSTKQTYKVLLETSISPSCDSNNELQPVVKSLKPKMDCADGSECVVIVELESKLDWALALFSQNSNENNKLSGTLQGSSNDELVVIGIFSNRIDSATVNSIEDLISLCSPTINISGSYLSLLPSCNRAQVCLGSSSSSNTECTQSIIPESIVSATSCSDTDSKDCSGHILLSESPFSCSVLSSPERFVYVKLTVADSASSSITKTSKLVEISPSLENIEGNVSAGISSLLLSGENVCKIDTAESTINSTATIPIPFSTVSASTDGGKLNISFDTPLDFVFAGSKLSVSYSRCGETSNAIEFVVEGGAPNITGRDFRFKVGEQLSVTLDGENFPSNASYVELVFTAANETITGLDLETRAEDSNRFHITSSTPLSSSLVGKELFLEMRVLPSKLNSTLQRMGKVCDGQAESCEGGEGMTIADPPKETSNGSGILSNAGLSGGLIAGIVIAFLAVLGAVVEFKIHRKRYIKNLESQDSDPNDADVEDVDDEIRGNDTERTSAGGQFARRRSSV